MEDKWSLSERTTYRENHIIGESASIYQGATAKTSYRKFLQFFTRFKYREQEAMKNQKEQFCVQSSHQLEQFFPQAESFHAVYQAVDG